MVEHVGLVAVDMRDSARVHSTLLTGLLLLQPASSPELRLVYCEHYHSALYMTQIALRLPGQYL